MPEHENTIARTGRWAVDRLAARLGHAPEPITDDDYGAGHLLSAPQTVSPGSNDRRFIALYPETNVVAISTKNVDITIRNAVAREARTGILIESRDRSARVLFLRSGHIAVEVFPHPAAAPLESPAPPQPAQADQIIVSDASARPGASGDENPASPDASAMRWGPKKILREIRTDKDGNPDPPTADCDDDYVDGLDQARKQPTPFEALAAFDAHRATPDRERQARVRWTGFLVHEPTIRTNNEGQVVAANLVVSEHRYDGAQRYAVYHRVFSTKAEARRIRDANLTTGTKLRIDGYLHPQTKEDKSGQVVADPRVYASHVSILKRADTGSEPAGERPQDAESRAK